MSSKKRMDYKHDSYYIDEVMNGDTHAFSFLVEKHKDMVFTVALKITGNREDAEEIAQDAFIKAFTSLSEFKQKAKFSTWIYRIVYNASISKIRKKKAERVSLNSEIVENYTLDEIYETLERFEPHEQKNMVDRAIEALQPQEKLIIELYYMNDTPVDEISEITGLSVSNVKVKLFRIRNKMQGMLQQIASNKLKKVQS